MHKLDELLLHAGVRGMKWGVRRDRNKSGGADGKEESTKVVVDNSRRGKLKAQLNSMSRERQWKKIVREMDKLSTKDIQTVTSRIKLENDLKTYSRSNVGNKKDKADYLRREHMSDAELKRKVNRLRAKEQLKKSVSDASKEQREMGEKVVNIAKSISIRYALNKTIKSDDVLSAFGKPKESASLAQKDLQRAMTEKIIKAAKRANNPNS